MSNTYLDILGLKPGATKREIKSAYRQLSKKYHPDINSAHNAREMFIEINEAYKFLMDVGPGKQQRAYDYDPFVNEYARWREKAREYAWKQAREETLQRNELLRQILSVFDKVAIGVAVLNLLFALDYLLPPKEYAQKITEIIPIYEVMINQSDGKIRRKHLYDDIYFESYSMRFESNQTLGLDPNGQSLVHASPIFRKPKAASLTIYGELITFPQHYGIHTVFGYLIPGALAVCLFYFFIFKTPDHRLTLALFLSVVLALQLYLFFRF
ncbi:MAG: J domain-containing protein [Cyclobacteriaceae bacterium]|nr:J domain-containing protein [Cyclobacteriaceae bacterium]